MMAPMIDAAMGRSRTIITMLVLILLAGAYSYNAIPKESSPDIDIPMIYVSMRLEGISPDDAERLLVRPMEQELSAIEGVKEMRSSGFTGGGYVLLEFRAGFNKEKALDDAQKAVDQVRPDLPEGMDGAPKVTEVNFSLFPVLVVTLSGKVPERTLVKVARNLQDKLEALPNVLEANITGDREELVEILVDPILLESYGLNGPEILQFFNRSNQLVAAGKLDTGVGQFAVTVPGLFEDVDDIMEMPLRTQGESVVKVKDIASIRRTFKDPESFARINGQRAVALNIVKRSGENIIETIEAVQRTVNIEGAFLPKALKINYTLDKSDGIRNMLADLQNNIISAILLVMIVVVAALGLRAAGLVGIAIPGAFLSGVLFLYVMGLTVNVVVLFALILSVGMLVDGAIVVTEYADRKMLEGLSKKEAYTVAAKRMAWPITASTATTLVVFAPLLFWPGVVGQFMRFMPITLISVLGSSLFMALIFVPVMGSLFGRSSAQDGDTPPQFSVENKGDLKNIGGVTGLYVRLLDYALKIPGLIFIATIGLMIGIQSLYGALGRGVEFFPDIEPEAATVLIHARGNLSALEEDTLLRSVEKRIFDIEGIRVFYSESGDGGSKGNENIAEDVVGKITIEFKDWQARKTANEILEEIRERTKDMAGFLVEARKQEEGPPTGKAIQIQLSSRFPGTLTKSVELVRQGLVEVGGFIDIEDERPLPGIEWELQVDRAQASKFGVDVSLIGDYVRMVTNGLKAAEYRPDDAEDEIDVVIRHSAEIRTIDQLSNIRIDTGQGSIPISNFVKKVPKPAVGRINRSEQRRVMNVKAGLPPEENVDAKVTAMKEWLETNWDKFDPRVQLSFKGEDEDQKEAQSFLTKAFVIALFMMAIILVTQFNSFYSAFLILFAVVMSTIGVMIGLLVTQQPFGIIMSGVGVIALAGIVVNNNIVLIDTFDTLCHSRKFTVREAILHTGAQRLRPVLLTTITTVLGLLPMAMQLNVDFSTREVTLGAPSTQWWVQLATAIIFGLSFSTVLTLIVTPSALMLREKMSGWWRKYLLLFRRKHA